MLWLSLSLILKSENASTNVRFVHVVRFLDKYNIYKQFM